MNVKRVHYFSGITITVFIALHLANHLYSLIGVEEHIKMMESLRLIYRNTFAEVILLLAVFVQIVSGMKLFLKKRKVAFGFFGKLQIWSGLYLAIFFIIHLGAVMSGRYILELDTNIYFGVAGMNTFPFSLFFIPYYSLAVISFFGHISAIHYVKMKKNLLGISPQKQSASIFVFGILLAIVLIYGLTKGFRGIDIPEEYGVMIGK